METRSSSQDVEQLLGAACARSAPAELLYEDRQGAVATARVRLLKMEENRILADRPIGLDSDCKIPAGVKITVHASIHGTRYQFDSVIEQMHRRVPVNRRQTVHGIALRKPTSLSESQRRANLRVSMVGYDPINVEMVRPSPDVPDACSIDTEMIVGWLIDLSVGGALILVDRRVLASVAPPDRFFLTFSLSSVDEPFYMLASVQHTRIVRANKSLRVGLSFRPWRGQHFLQDQRRLSRFIVEHERRMLRRRR